MSSGRVSILGICGDVFDMDTNAGDLFANYVNMFLKLKQESSVYQSWVQSEDDKDIYIEDYRRAEGIALDKASI